MVERLCTAVNLARTKTQRGFPVDVVPPVTRSKLTSIVGKPCHRLRNTGSCFNATRYLVPGTSRSRQQRRGEPVDRAAVTKKETGTQTARARRETEADEGFHLRSFPRTRKMKTWQSGEARHRRPTDRERNEERKGGEIVEARW
ncbi:uncharacterized protein LOC143146026 isoform X2 [Ptiloglossa arizonensis]|uniref:uncharacterized protein LOC143146026 isoform X2 n=1 Tax=Ptiloglossa arizonensis TaxID=3350558 RepID=UPI003FA1304C